MFLISNFYYYNNFCPLSDPIKWDPILDQFSMITRPYPGVNDLQIIPFPAAHTCIANSLESPQTNIDKFTIVLRTYNKVICIS